MIFENITKTTKENLESKNSEAKDKEDKNKEDKGKEENKNVEDKDKNIEEFSFTENDNNSFWFKKIKKSKDGFSFSQFSSYSYSKEL